MKPHLWNFVCGIVFLLVGLDTALFERPLDWPDVVLVVVTLLAALACFGAAWRGRRKASSRSTPPIG